MSSGSFSSFTQTPVLDTLRHPLRRLWQRNGHAAHQLYSGSTIGHGEPILVFPMFGAGPESTLRLRAALDQAGFVSYDWGRGVDNGPPPGGFAAFLRELEDRVVDVFETERCGLTLLGWGLSGIYARELAKRTAPLVRQVITLGTPFNTAGGRCDMLSPLHDESGSLPSGLAQQLREAPPVPSTSIYSLSDVKVPWPMCLDTESLASENILVPAATHEQLANTPKVRDVVTDRLVQPEDSWRPFAG
jgi:hypothetical protein